MKNIYLIILLAVLLAFPAAVFAQSPDALISQVNSLRASYGLEPYTVDQTLMVLVDIEIWEQLFMFLEVLRRIVLGCIRYS